jgi:hypothetical protein
MMGNLQFILLPGAAREWIQLTTNYKYWIKNNCKIFETNRDIIGHYAIMTNGGVEV